MKQFIRYLYEYEHGKRVRNIGFVKVEQAEERCVIHIHGKGFSVVNEKVLELFLFYIEQRRCIGIAQGKIDKIGPGINYRLEYGVEDVGDEEIFRSIKGIIVSNHSNHKYAAVWDDTSIDVDEMIVRRDPPRLQQAMEEKVLRDVYEKKDERVDEEQEENASEIEETPLQNSEIRVPKTAEPEDRAPETAEPEERIPETAESEERIPETAESGFEKQETTVAEEEMQADITYEKIRREDLARLPRKEWRLANNHFLLHGYHNYNHLIVIKENGHVFLGVPGTFHEREQQAAKAFGFPQFHRLEYSGIELMPEEKNEQGDFGYWCRQVEQFRV